MIGTTIKSAWPIATITIRVYCTCGGAMHLTMNKPGEAEFIMEAFAESHSGKGHKPTDSKTAAKERRRLEKMEMP